MILNNIIGGKFEYKKGNTLASLAEAFLYSLEINSKDSSKLDVPFDIMNGKQQM